MNDRRKSWATLRRSSSAQRALFLPLRITSYHVDVDVNFAVESHSCKIHGVMRQWAFHISLLILFIVLSGYGGVQHVYGVKPIYPSLHVPPTIIDTLRPTFRWQRLWGDMQYDLIVSPTNAKDAYEWGKYRREALEATHHTIDRPLNERRLPCHAIPKPS